MKQMGKYVDWQFRFTTWITILAAVACVVCAQVMPESYGDKNSPVETVQMLVLAAALWVSFTARNHKTLFRFAFLVIFLVLAREVNFGRTLFVFADPVDVRKFPKWSDMEYGWLAHVAVGAYMVWLLVYFIWRKVWQEIKAVLSTTRIPVWDALLCLSGLLVGLGYELLHDCLVEELGELVLYVGGVGILYLYTRDKVNRLI